MRQGGRREKRGARSGASTRAAPRNDQGVPKDSPLQGGRTSRGNHFKGPYNGTMDGVRLTKERNDDSKLNLKEGMFLDYSDENLDREEGMYLSCYDFNGIDEEGHLWDTHPASDSSRRAKEAPRWDQEQRQRRPCADDERLLLAHSVDALPPSAGGDQRFM
ncbi:hypothetical protein ABB02_00144 [Clostridiaceae bacterium JG1575]|nr:hypothetical protein ABB02_00144 [Clostridiaceae bacterium JG1575]